MRVPSSETRPCRASLSAQLFPFLCSSSTLSLPFPPFPPFLRPSPLAVALVPLFFFASLNLSRASSRLRPPRSSGAPAPLCLAWLFRACVGPETPRRVSLTHKGTRYSCNLMGSNPRRRNTRCTSPTPAPSAVSFSVATPVASARSEADWSLIAKGQGDRM